MTYISSLPAQLSVGELAAVIAGLLLILQSLVGFAFAVPQYHFSERHGEAGDREAARRSMINTPWPVIIRILRLSRRTERTRLRQSWQWTRVWQKIWPLHPFRLIRLIPGLCIILFVIGGFLTPIPLGDGLALGSSNDAAFVPCQDLSPFGRATFPLPVPSMTRRCGNSSVIPCPGSGATSTIAETYQKYFGANYSGQQLTRPFDIRYRTWYLSDDFELDDTQSGKQPVGDMNPVVTHVLDDDYVLVDGLIVDMIHGGIGLRNHTVPASQPHGATWTEPILWLTPVTECVSTNLSFHYVYSGFNNISGGYLQDDGGFFDAAQGDQYQKWFDGGWNTNHDNVPDLSNTAQLAAWWSNNLTQQMLKISPPYARGTRYSHYLSTYFRDFVSPGTLLMSNIDGGYIDILTNDERIFGLHFSFLSLGDRICSGYDATSEPAKGMKPFVRCGYLYSMPDTDEALGDNLRFDEGSAWSQKLYTCASAVQASVKAVTFVSANGQYLDNVTVSKVESYPFTEEDAPMWGLEVADNYTIDSINRVWGLLGSTTANSKNFLTTKTPEFYLPATSFASYLWTAKDLFAGGTVFQSAWNDVYYHAAQLQGQVLRQIPSYRADQSYSLALRWRELSKTAQDSAKICNLIWTDLVAFAISSSQTGFAVESEPKQSSMVGTRQATPYIVILVYSQFWYCIVAIFGTALFLVGLALTISIWIWTARSGGQGMLDRLSEFVDKDDSTTTQPSSSSQPVLPPTSSPATPPPRPSSSHPGAQVLLQQGPSSGSLVSQGTVSQAPAPQTPASQGPTSPAPSSRASASISQDSALHLTTSSSSVRSSSRPTP